jgi:hypothetical protein
MSRRTLSSFFPRQSPSSLILLSISLEASALSAGGAGRAADFFGTFFAGFLMGFF